MSQVGYDEQAENKSDELPTSLMDQVLSHFNYNVNKNIYREQITIFCTIFYVCVGFTTDKICVFCVKAGSIFGRFF
jgi:hypothetical protein